MSDKPPFDFVKASFFLVAFVIFVHCVVVLAGVAFCWVHVEQELTTRCSDLRGQLIEMLAAARPGALSARPRRVLEKLTRSKSNNPTITSP